MESPETLSKKVASLFPTRRSSKERVSANSSSAALGNPASTVPRTLAPDTNDLGISLPV